MPIALMIHGSSHMVLLPQDCAPHKHAFCTPTASLPLYRPPLCPEVSLFEGPTADACNALE
ncbi:hypothetical protein F5882DRAFT_462001 [Hyaloscypha sp. PMI_1271]|nr:hypothetical protein F5882DRAFT_462001 [Hyaloscypha sp. PMI_1271]